MLTPWERFAKIIRIVLTGSAFLLFWSGGAVLCWFVIPLVTFVHRRDPVLAQRRCREVVCHCFRLHLLYMRICRLVFFDARMIEAQLPKGPFVLVANHPTLIDVVLILASYPSICCVANGKYFRSPLVGSMLRACGHIDAGEEGGFGGLAVIDGAVERLKAGDPVLIFPEGTRSPLFPEGIVGLGRFRGGAFAIAAMAKVPVVPISISVRPPGLMKGMSWYTVPNGTICYEMVVLPPVEPDAKGRAANYAIETRALIEAHMSA